MWQSDSQALSRDLEIRKILWLILGLNVFVAVAKLAYGYKTSTISLWADGLHSLFDGASNIIGLVGIWAASHPPDDSHPYGHRKFESFAAFGISVFLFLACYKILESSYLRFSGNETPTVTAWSFLIMISTLGINLFVTRYEHQKSQLLKSDILHADSMHTLSDVYSSISVIFGLIAIKLGFTLLDPIIAILIAGFIGRTGFKILFETTRVLSDASRVDPLRIQEVVMKVQGVRSCHRVRTRGSEHYIFVDCHIHVPAEMTAEQSHELVHRIEDRLKQEMKEVAEVVIHVEPENSKGKNPECL